MLKVSLSLFLISFFILGCSITRYSGPPSDHFNGQKFFNPGINNDKSLYEVLKWKLTSTIATWPEWVDIEKSSWKPKASEDPGLQITWINHATVLLEMGSLNILTDPVYSKRTSPVTWLGPSRVRPPGIELKDLPKIDVILISHNHYDHLDMKSLKELHERFQPKVFAPLGDCKLISEIKGVNCEEMDWGDMKTLGGVEFHFTQCQHWSARGLRDRNASLWGSYVVKSQGRQIYFAGDTGYGEHFKNAHKNFGAMDLSLLPIGAYEPRWFMKTQHMNPEEAVQAHLDLHSKKSLGIHFGTFQLTDEGIDEPKVALKKALQENNISEQDFLAIENGSTFRLE